MQFFFHFLWASNRDRQVYDMHVVQADDKKSEFQKNPWDLKNLSFKVPLRRKSNLLKLPFLDPKLVFRLKTSRKNVIQTNLTKKVP